MPEHGGSASTGPRVPAKVRLLPHSRPSGSSRRRDAFWRWCIARISPCSTAHQETLDLLGQFTDEQLIAPISPSLITNTNAGNLFVANAQHAALHIIWIEEGFRQDL